MSWSRTRSITLRLRSIRTRRKSGTR